jgi:hypothetical protein
MQTTKRQRTLASFTIPEQLTDEGEKVAKIIRNFFVKVRRTSTGGSRTFYSPKEWADRGERYGCDSLLIVVHDGGDVAAVLNPGYGGNPKILERLNLRLSEAGFILEPCTCWYAAVYPVPTE